VIVLVLVSAQYHSEVSSNFLAVLLSAQYGSEGSLLMSAQHGATNSGILAVLLFLEYGSEGSRGLFFRNAISTLGGEANTGDFFNEEGIIVFGHGFRRVLQRKTYKELEYA